MTDTPLRSEDINTSTLNQAYDLLVNHYQTNGATEEDAKKTAQNILQKKMKELGHTLASATEMLIRNYEAKKVKNSLENYTIETSNAVAQKILKTITETHAVQETTAPETHSPETPSLTTPDVSTENNTKSSQSKTTEISNSTKDHSMHMNTFDKNSQLDSINAVLNVVTGQSLTDINTLISAINDAYSARSLLEAEVEKAKSKLELLKSGSVDDANNIKIEQTPYKPFTVNYDANSPMLMALNTLIKANSGDKTLGDMIDILRNEETKIAENTTNLRVLMRDIRNVGTRVTGAEDLGSSDLDYEVEYVNAKTLFKSSFGMTELLDFEVPVLKWSNPNPDVPNVDDSFRFYSPVLANALNCLTQNQIMWLYGESGCGKSEFWAQIAARLGMPLIRLNMDSHLSRSDLIGTNRLVPGPNGQPIMQFEEGLIPVALQTPSILLIDEFDLGEPEIMPVLQPVLEGKGVRILEHGGRYVAPHSLSRIAITANTIGLGSENMMYNNAHEQSAATRDRISRYIEMPYLPQDMEIEVVMARIPEAEKDFVTKVVTLANKVREAYRASSIQQVFSTRTVLGCAKMHSSFLPLYGDDKLTTEETLKICVLNRMDSQSRSVVKGFIDGIF